VSLIMIFIFAAMVFPFAKERGNLAKVLRDSVGENRLAGNLF